MTITQASPAGVLHPDVVTSDQLYDVLNSFGLAGQALAVPAGVNIEEFFVRAPGEFYWDNPAESKSKRGPGVGRTFYIVVPASVGYRSIWAHVHGEGLFIGTVYGDVFRGWSQVADQSWVEQALAEHEASVNHPYATESTQGFVKLATKAEALSRTNALAAITSLRLFEAIFTFGLGPAAVRLSLPDGGTLETVLQGTEGGFYQVNGTGYPGFPVGGQAYLSVVCTDKDNKSISLITAEDMWTTTMVAKKLQPWSHRLSWKDLPKINGHVQEAGKDITLTANDVGAYSKPESDTLLAQKVPITRKINGHTLDKDVTLSAGDVGTWTKDEADARYILRSEGTLPVGTAIIVFDITPAKGYVFPAGQTISQSANPKLYAKFGGKLPDMRGVVPRGLDSGRGLDPGRTLGSYQEDAGQKITGTFPCVTRWRAHEKITGAFYRINGQWNVNMKNGGGDDWGMTFGFDSSRQTRTAAETRMKNIAVNYAMRAE